MRASRLVTSPPPNSSCGLPLRRSCASRPGGSRAGALATAPSAAAKTNLLSIDEVSLHTPGLQVKVTYSCDVGMDHELVANATTLNHSPHDQPIAAGTVKKDRLVCDYNDHVALGTMRPAFRPWSGRTVFGKVQRLRIIRRQFASNTIEAQLHKKAGVAHCRSLEPRARKG